jgi:hypothetical protein
VSRPAICAALCSLALSVAVRASPWLEPGDSSLRHDIQLLADAGVLRGPVTSWPLSWPEIAGDVLDKSGEGLDDATLGALLNVQRRARAAAIPGFTGLGLKASLAREPDTLRGFEDTPRDEAEATVRAGWMSRRFALELRATGVADPTDGRRVRPDGSYLGVNIGNFMVSAGYVSRWWGPGWDGSLILSSNARPMPMLSVERNYADPFRHKLLRWLGPWRASLAVGQSDEQDVAIADVRFLAARVSLKPRSWLELGFTRTAQWCGAGRPCGWDSFRDMLAGRDNEVVDGSIAQQPGNQMAGYDLRLRSPWRALPVAVYSQWSGEDEAGGLPSKFLGLFGVEAWRNTPWGRLRVHAEFADTACSFSRRTPEFECAYRNGAFPQGYAYRGRSLGHAMDNDSRMYSLGAILNREGGDSLSIRVRRVELNRDGGSHAISTVPLDLENVELRYQRAFGVGTLAVGVGYDDESGPATATSRARGFLTWHQGF